MTRTRVAAALGIVAALAGVGFVGYAWLSEEEPGWRSQILEEAYAPVHRDPEFLARAFRLELSRDEDDRISLNIGNRAGHRIPGTTRRKITFKIELFDSVGDLVEEAEHTIDHRAYLPVDDELELSLRRDGVRAEVTITHDTEGLKKPVVILSRTFTP